MTSTAARASSVLEVDDIQVAGSSRIARRGVMKHLKCYTNFDADGMSKSSPLIVTDLAHKP